MNIRIDTADMSYSKQDGYLGHVEFAAEGHPHAYEITLQSKNANDWAYSLNFARESGEEAHIEAVEAALEEDDELFDELVQAAMSRLER
ncbi:hypothetical protein SD70_02785 [Gordoniibacillus kamchatkensis]|uniref:Uncharacterized protein n=1 Tax=Gordoniibacillus kamchatkensis TaxID=1590651 RepID=A0ABR5AM67_9BACL|nr:hypothetical protein [Paenibacillus sp. VKM B-2647]KIL42120.1 hypothetical protein SD70_02785 [Paenibacillus sp. VKM B-2647]